MLGFANMTFSAVNQQIATTTIKKLGFSVCAAWNGKEALDYVEACRKGRLTKPDIILMDVQMPVIDGYKCTHILRHHLPYKAYTYDVPIVAMTASAIRGDREKCTKAGMDDYLSKPVKRNILERMLVRWSKSRRKADSVSSSSANQSVSDCSESPDQCVSADIPTPATFGFASGYNPRTLNEVSAPSDPDGMEEDERTNLLTPRPVTSRKGSHEMNPFPFGVSQPARKLDSDELAMQLRDDKLIDAADVSNGGTSSKPSISHSLSEGDSLTEENIQKLDQGGVRSPTREL